jgi:hypothetical protein
VRDDTFAVCSAYRNVRLLVAGKRKGWKSFLPADTTPKKTLFYLEETGGDRLELFAIVSKGLL